MAHTHRLFYSLLVILLSAVSCTPAATVLPGPTPTTALIATAVPTEPATLEPTVLPSPVPSDTPLPTAVNPSLSLPNGIATYNGSDSVSYYDLQGQLLGAVQSTSLGTGIYQQAVIAGPLTYSPGPVLPPLVFYKVDNGGDFWLNDSNNVTLLKAAPNLQNLIGVPGKDILAYSLLQYLDIGLQSQLFLTDLPTIASAALVLENVNTEIYAVRPLAIAIDKDLPVGIWYTTVPYGIGGDIVFEPRKALDYLNLADDQTKTYLDMTRAPVGISADQSWVAYTPVAGAGPLSLVNDFDFSTALTIPLMPDSDRGAGVAEFSPDNQYVAWKEAAGSIAADPPNFRQTIRIATLDANVIAEIPDTSLQAVSGYAQISWVIPVGWIDTQTLALQVQGSSTGDVSLLSIKADGSGLAFLAPGSFVGFLYP